MQILRNAMLLTAGSLFAMSAPMWAQSSGSMGQTQAASHPSKAAMSDVNQHAADLLNTINKDEINSGQMMADHTQNDQVKDYAQMLVNDHKELQNKLEQAAQQSNINLTTNNEMMQRADKMNDSIKNQAQKTGDENFARHEARSHRNAIHELQRLETHITDPQLKTVVQDAIPIMQKHLNQAQKLEKSLTTSGGKL